MGTAIRTQVSAASGGWVPLAIALGGAAILLWGLAAAVTQARHRRTWTRTTGVVVGYAHSGESSNPRVRYRLADGREITRELAFAVDIGWYPTGHEVPVWYDPARPTRFTARVQGSHVAWVFLCLVGAVMLAVGTAMVRMS